MYAHKKGYRCLNRRKLCEDGGRGGERESGNVFFFFVTAVPQLMYAVGGGLNVFCVAFGQNRNASPTIPHSTTQYFQRSWMYI